jgi:hypothetical protein
VLEPIEIDITKIPVFWINLDEATERKEKMEALFDKHKFENVTRIPGVKHDFTTEIKIPSNTDAFYLGISAWARWNGESGPYLRGQPVAPNTVRIQNMLSAHAIYYRSRRYADACRQAVDLYIHTHKDHHDIGFANIMGDFNVYCNEKPILYQSSSENVTKITLSEKEED